jgi:tetratricopeptide (TPR) repeat protein
MPQHTIQPVDPLNSDAGQMLGKRSKKKHEEYQDIQFSIIIPLSGFQEHVRTCAERIKKHTPEAHEIIFIDAPDENGTNNWLKQHIKGDSHCKLLKCENDVSLATRYNEGIKASKGEYIVLLSSDVAVTEKWLSGMVECINISPDAGIVGPMSNNYSGLKNIPDANYDAIDHLDEDAESFRERYRHRRIPSRVVNGFCMLFRRDLVTQIGFLDEGFKAGGIENEEFCLRAALEGHTNLIAGDVFIHHYGNSGVKKDDPNDAATRNRDRKRLSEKWSGIDTESPLGKKLFALNILENAVTAYQRGDMDNSVDMLLKGIGNCPDDERLYHALSMILMDAKLFKDALDVLNEMPQDLQDLQDLKRLELVGYCNAGMGLYGKAEEYAEKLLAQNSGSAPALNLKGMLGYEKSKNNEAKIFYNRAIESDPGYGEAYTNLGNLKWNTDQREKALDLFERGFILSPTVTHVFTTYHSTIASFGAFARAEPVFREAIKFYPHHEKLKLLFIDILIQQGKYDAAMKEIEDAMVLFDIKDGFLSAALRIRDMLGPKNIKRDSAAKRTVSLCMIVKNEAEDLAKCLRSVKPVVDEMIVVDTGSIDRTKEIASVFGAKVYDFKWTNDFSEARNFSISKASGDWIFLLDADEIVSPLDYDHFLSMVREPPSGVGAYAFETRNYMVRANTIGWIANDGKYDNEEAAEGWIPSTKVRLFPNVPQIRFEYPVHEMVEPSLIRGNFVVKKGSVPIHHYGKLNQEKSDCKGEAYYLIGRKKLDEMGDDIIAIRELAIQAGLLKKWEEAIELWQRLINIRPEMAEAFVNMGTAYWHLGEYEKALSSAKKAMALAPHMNESAYNYAICELHLGNAEQAVSVLEELLVRSPEYLPAQFMLTAAYCCDGNKRKGLNGFMKLRKTNTGSYIAISCHELAKGLISAQKTEYAMLLLDAAIESKNINKDVLALFSECLKRRDVSNDTS